MSAHGARLASLALLSALLSACGAVSAPVSSVAAPGSEVRVAIDRTMDDWHAAAAESDEARYFSHFTADGVFLGTDATERWSVEAFREYAHPVFAAGRGWNMRAIRRDVVVRGDVAWLDEDLDAVNLGPARGRAVLVLEQGRWRIAHYDLAITVPNERFGEVRALLQSAAPTAEPQVDE